MAIVNMKKLTLAVADSVKSDMMAELQVLGAVHIDELDIQSAEEGAYVSDTWALELNDNLADYSNLEDQRKELAGAIARIQDLFQSSLPSFEVTSLDKIKSLRSSYNIDQLAQDLRQLDTQTKDSATRHALISQELADVKKWSHTIDNFDALYNKSAVLTGVAGGISKTSFDAFYADIINTTKLADVITAYHQDQEIYCYVVASPEVWEEVNTVVKNHPFYAVTITRRTGDTADMINDMLQELKELESTQQQCLKKWAEYKEKFNDLVLLHDSLEMDIQHGRSLNKARSTEKVSFFRAWVPEHLLPKVTAILSIYNKSIDVQVDNPIENEYEKVPVSLKNNGFTKPFAALTNMYGTPKYGATVDPTPHLSIFYFIYYGMCLGDALYGAVLALFSVFMAFKNRANQSSSNFYALLAWSGFASMIAGVFFGSYAGDLFSKYIPITVLDTLRFKFSDGAGFFDKPLFVLFISLLLGAIQLWYGYWIKFVVSIKNNGIVSALLNELPWIILLAGFFGWAVFDWIAGLAELSFMTDTIRTQLFLLMKVGAGLVLLSATIRGFQKGFVSGIVGPLAGAWDLYGISGYLSNLLSYARLLALGLSSGIIANVFNQLSWGIIESLAGITPVLAIFGIAMLVFLHVFNLVLGGFGAFVHALRLQFVEFFGQFMEGGGKEYQPLQCKGSHYTVR